MEKEHILKMSNISKSFPGVKALSNVDLELSKGEVLALLGENGAGKSTLIKILSGDYTADEGEIWIDGEKVIGADPRKTLALGVSVIYQEMNLGAALSVAENIFIGNLPLKKGPLKLVDFEKLRVMTEELLERIGLKDMDPFTPVASLSIAEQQMVEIAKALSHHAKILVMDEPTAALNDEEIAILFGLVRRLKADGTAIIYISHRLDEVFEITDRIQVMRDGHRVADLNTADTNKDELITHMVGREVTQMYPDRDQNHIGDVVLKVENLSSNYIKDVSFDVRAGEIVGFFGLMGSGRTEIVEMVFGARKKLSGKITVSGIEQKIEMPADGKAAGMGYVPSDRKGEGLFLTQSVAMNISNNVLNDISGKIGILDFKKEAGLVNEWIDALRIKTPGMDTLTQSLSGGNQQKVVLAKWLTSKPKILILNEPTRGIDVGAKAEIYNLINELSKQGLAFIMVSSELPEVMAMSDRVVVIHEGRYKGTVMREDFTQEKLLATAIGGDHE